MLHVNENVSRILSFPWLFKDSELTHRLTCWPRGRGSSRSPWAACRRPRRAWPVSGRPAPPPRTRSCRHPGGGGGGDGSSASSSSSFPPRLTCPTTPWSWSHGALDSDAFRTPTEPIVKCYPPSTRTNVDLNSAPDGEGGKILKEKSASNSSSNSSSSTNEIESGLSRSRRGEKKLFFLSLSWASPNGQSRSDWQSQKFGLTEMSRLSSLHDLRLHYNEVLIGQQ